MTTTSFYHFPPSQILARNEINYNNNYKDNDNDDEDDNNADFLQANLKGYVRESSLAPVLFVIDFDNTLAVYDEMYILDNNSTNDLPSTYTRPFMYEFLDYIKSVNTNNVIVMWTAGTDIYIKQNLLLLNIAQYFDKILSRVHCHESKEKYNKCKSHAYLISLFPNYKRMRSILIDNLAYKNGSGTGYSEILSIKPYTLLDVAKTYGAFGIASSNIENIAVFLISKGTRGIITNEKDNYNIWMGKEKERKKKFRNGGRCDTTLLNLILHLQNRFFKIYRENYGKFCGYNNNESIYNDTPIIKTQTLDIKNNYFSIAEINFI